VAGYTGVYSTTLDRLNTPQDVTFDGYQYMYVADYGNNRILQYSPGKHSLSNKGSYHIVL
jgi:hypothetical protein